MATSAHEVNYSKIVDSDTRVLVFGEAHASVVQKQELIDHMKELANAGFTILAYEAMPSSKQYLISEYRAGTLSREGLAQEFRALWGYDPEPYVMAIDAALEANMSVIFLDTDLEHVDLSLPNWAELELAVNKLREAHWVELMANICKSDEKAKIVALVGSAHASSIKLQLSQNVVATKTIILDGGEFFYDTLVTEAARHSHLQDKRLIVKTALPGAEGDYHLHVPQANQATIIGKRN
ncbi:MAG: ChaN family lipoprotein [Candidatus Melainabacteria bacterium]|nr:ChaN family lipoprotein [Candidatus Melainabacteria bacterium]